MPRVLPGLWEEEVNGRSGLKYSCGFSSPASPEHSLEAKWRGRGHGGRACSQDSEGLHCNAEELKLLVLPPVLINKYSTEKAESKFLMLNFCCFGHDLRPHYSQAV